MSEKIRGHHESGPEQSPGDDSHEKRIQAHHEAQAGKAHHEHQDRIESIIKTIEKEATKSEDTVVDKQETKADADEPQFATSEMSSAALKQNLRKIQSNLSGPEKQFSKVIHNQTVDKLSEATGKTVARPSGLLVGGTVALLTNIAVLFICNRYGYEYNYLLGIAGFGGGFLLGLVGEFAVRRIIRR